MNQHRALVCDEGLWSSCELDRYTKLIARSKTTFPHRECRLPKLLWAELILGRCDVMQNDLEE
ncbi:hypothetical protein SAMN05216299_10894 [Nitrosospira sp. Nsp14]|nr:hypothetical protein SAMN05216299_10894 [Nitrosospira sp. Nsp14]